jgi:hypothetical protein
MPDKMYGYMPQEHSNVAGQGQLPEHAVLGVGLCGC